MTKSLTTIISEESLEKLNNEYPKEMSFSRILLPRIKFVSQDRVEGKGKTMKVVMEGGTFVSEKLDKESGEWVEEELGKKIDAQIFYHRRQLRYWDQSTESFVNSPIYDDENDVIPLFQSKKEIARGTQKQLQEKFPPKEGRKISALEDERVLYVLLNGEAYQFSIKGGSKWAFLTYSRKINPATVITTLSSEYKENGAISWNQMTFTEKHAISEKQAREIIAKVGEIKTAITAEKSFYQNMTAAISAPETEADKEFKKF